MTGRKAKPRVPGVHTEADAARLLAAAASRIKSNGERPQIELRCGGSWLVAHFRLPGVLTLTPKGEAEPVITSKLGDPSTVATWRECL